MKPQQFINATDYESLEDDEKAIYTKQDGEDVEEGKEYAIDPVAALEYAQKAYTGKQKALSSLSNLKEKMEKKDERISELTKAQEEALEADGKYKELWENEKAARANEKNSYEERISTIVGTNRKKTKDNTVADAVIDLCGEKNVAIDAYIRTRMSIEVDDTGKPTVTVLDPAGNPSEQTLDDLKEEMRANTQFAGLLKGDGNSGGGASGGGGAGGGVGVTPEIKAAYTVGTENLAVRTQFAQSHPEQHKKLMAAYTEEMKAKTQKRTPLR